MYYMGFTYHDAYTLPIWQRIWFMERIGEEFKKSSDAGSRAAHDNTPESRSLQGRSRTHVPANQRRFT